jgi:hypothetical protein
LDVNWKSKVNNFTNENFKELVYGWFFIIFSKFLIDFAYIFVWSSLDNFKDIFKYNYLVFKPNYLTSFLITIFYFYNYFISFSVHQHEYEKKN